MAMQRRCPQCQRVYPSSHTSCAHDQSVLVDDAELPLAPSDPLLGQILENCYRIDRILGAGGMGTVYLAEHTGTQNRYAIKVMHRELLGNETALKRFDREARALSAIDHPHVVEVYDHGWIPTGVPFLVMEYLQGTTLRDCLDNIPGPGLPLLQAVNIALQAAQALDHVHDRGIVHRDRFQKRMVRLQNGASHRQRRRLDHADSHRPRHGL